MSSSTAGTHAARHPVFVCCSDEDRAVLDKIGSVLNHSGMEVDLIVGTDLDTGPLKESLDSNHGPGLYVICESEDLDRFQVRRLNGLFSARSGPLHRLMIVKLDPDHPAGIIAPIREEARKHQVALARAGAGESGVLAKKNAVSVVRTEITALASAGSSMRELIADELDEDEALGASLWEAGERALAGGTDPNLREAAAAAVLHVENPLAALGEAGIGEAAEGGSARAEEPAAARVGAAGVRGEAATDPPRTPARGRAIGLTVVALGVVVALGFAAYRFRGQGELGAGSDAPAPSDAAGREHADRADGTARPPAPATRGELLARVEARADAAVDPETRAADETRARGTDEGAETSASDEAAAAAAELTPPAAEGTDAVDEATPSPSPSPTPPAPLANGGGDADADELREFEGLQIQAPWSKTSAWHKASSRCKGSRVAGHDDWRLPSSSELVAMQRAGMLARGSYWSSTRVDEEATMSLVVRSDRERPRPWERTDLGGASLCVRRLDR